jgi:hypothetical protein
MILTRNKNRAYRFAWEREVVVKHAAPLLGRLVLWGLAASLALLFFLTLTGMNMP